MFLSQVLHSLSRCSATSAMALEGFDHKPCPVMGGKYHAYVWGRAQGPQLNLWSPTLLTVTDDDEADKTGFGQEEISQIAASMAARDGHRLALSRNGKLYAWGLSTDAQLGLRNFSDEFLVRPTPVELSPDIKVTYAACGGYHSFAVTSEGALYGWGRATHGLTAVHDFDTLPRAHKYPEMAVQVTPARVSGLDRHFVVHVACGFFHSVCTTREGQMFSWGVARYGRLGIAGVDGLPTFEGLAYQAKPQVHSILFVFRGCFLILSLPSLSKVSPGNSCVTQCAVRTIASH